ncbi:hypothetical protein QEZ40_005110 [Streptomyces katrae]|uniref:Yeast cell wall synthesis Kre9/Knh1-like N-terminal domain-containing protein n=1 Tax=Streptomyces katrae TaxID=68223 RepID=A0ABT7H236_9ACTN|nr:Ser-Thr-rich GPI-anchored membrane family protein [Streptomyces katrae]MDK9499678.1 hypothetical protein [Streptomyces katrae]
MPTSSPTSAWSALRDTAGRINALLSRPAASVLLGADDLIVDAPREGAVWEAGTEQLVRWHLTGPVDPVDIHLVQRRGVSTVTRAVLATGLPAHRTTARVRVPAGLPAGEYLVLVTSQGMLDAYSRPVHIVTA